MNKEELYEAIAEQKVEMTPGERMAAYMQGEEVDCIPHSVLSAEDAMGVAWGFNKLDLYNDPNVRAAQLKKQFEKYGEASIPMGMNLRDLGVALGSEEIVSPKDENHIGERFLTDYSKLSVMEEFEVSTNEWVQKKFHFGREVKKILPDLPMAGGITGPISAVVAMRPIELILRETRKCPEQVHRMLDLTVECNLKYIKACFEEFGIASWFIADPVTTTDILGPKQYQEFSKPYQKKLFDGIYEITGQIPGTHICGHTKGIWKDLADIGFKTFSVDNCESMSEFREMVGDKMFLMGNVSPVDIMHNGTIDDVIEGVKDSLRNGATNPCGYMLNTGCQVVMGTPEENIDAFYYAARKYGAGAQIGKMPRGMAGE